MEDENLYDEFGNYIGPEMDLSDGGSSSGDEGDDQSRDGVAASPDAGSDYAYERPVSATNLHYIAQLNQLFSFTGW